MKSKYRSLISNNKGFTLIEIIISLGIVAVIGTLVLTTIIKANANTELANAQTFMDNITQSAKEGYKANPEAVINNTTNIGSVYPFATMFYKNNGLGSEKTYGSRYSSNLTPILDTSTNPTPVKYRLEIKFTPKNKTSSTDAGFEFLTTRYTMTSTAWVYDKNGAESKEPLYTKSFDFDDIATKDTAGSNSDFVTVTFKLMGGTVKNEDLAGATLVGDVLKMDVPKGGKIENLPKASKTDNKYIGYSTSEDGSSGLFDNAAQNLDGDLILYAQYLRTGGQLRDYMVTFQLRGDEKFDIPGVPKDARKVDKKITKDMTTGAAHISDIADINAFFGEDPVVKEGMKFVGWETIDNVLYTLNSKIDPVFITLYPILAESNAVPIDINVVFDITELYSDTSLGSQPAPLNIYPYSLVKLGFGINGVNGAAAVTSLELFQQKGIVTGAGIVGAPNHEEGNAPEAKLGMYQSNEYGHDKLYYQVEGGAKRYFLHEYIDDLNLDTSNKDSVEVKNINIKLLYNGVDLKGYTAEEWKGKIKTSTGFETVSIDQLNKVFNGHKAEFLASDITDSYAEAIKDAFKTSEMKNVWGGEGVKNVKVNKNNVSINDVQSENLIHRYEKVQTGEANYVDHIDKEFTLTIPTSIINYAGSQGINFNAEKIFLKGDMLTLRYNLEFKGASRKLLESYDHPLFSITDENYPGKRITLSKLMIRTETFYLSLGVGKDTKIGIDIDYRDYFCSNTVFGGTAEARRFPMEKVQEACVGQQSSGGGLSVFNPHPATWERFISNGTICDRSNKLARVTKHEEHMAQPTVNLATFVPKGEYTRPRLPFWLYATDEPYPK